MGVVVGYLKAMAEEKDVPYQSLINLYLHDCAVHYREFNTPWQEEPLQGAQNRHKEATRFSAALASAEDILR